MNETRRIAAATIREQARERVSGIPAPAKPLRQTLDQARLYREPLDIVPGVRIINATQHPIVLLAKDQPPIVWQASTHPVRVRTQLAQAQWVVDAEDNAIPIHTVEWTYLSPALPEEEGDVFYIVSRFVAEACRDVRSDLLVPGSNVYNTRGEVMGCETLLHFGMAEQ